MNKKNQTKVGAEIAAQFKDGQKRATLAQQAAKRDEDKRRSGDFVHEGQDMHPAFTKVSKLWVAKTITLEAMVRQVEEFAAQCQDFDGLKVQDLKIHGAKLVAGGQSFSLNETGLAQLGMWSGVPARYLEDLRDNDVALFDQCASRGLARISGPEKECFLRGRKDGDAGWILRALLSGKYAVLNNLPVVKLLADLVPGARASHVKFSDDLLRVNVLIPDSIRTEDDSDYGGGISVVNSETGASSFRQRPFVFRAICMNGNIWDRKNGVEIQKRHLGNLDMAKFRESMAMNIQEQIPLAAQHIEQVLNLKKFRVADKEMGLAIVSVAEREGLGQKAARAWLEGCRVEYRESNAKVKPSMLSAFGLVQGLTRAAQTQELQAQDLMETLSAKLIDGNWDKLMTAARSTVTEERVKEVLELA